jgi:hypothetical protein
VRREALKVELKRLAPLLDECVLQLACQLADVLEGAGWNEVATVCDPEQRLEVDKVREAAADRRSGGEARRAGVRSNCVRDIFFAHTCSGVEASWEGRC